MRLAISFRHCALVAFRIGYGFMRPRIVRRGSPSEEGAPLNGCGFRPGMLGSSPRIVSGLLGCWLMMRGDAVA